MELKQLFARFNIYHRMIFALVILVLVSAFWYGFKAQALIPVAISVLTAALLDIPLKFYKHREWEFPHCAIISGLFVGGLLSQNLPFYVYIAASAIAVLSKYIIRLKGKHIFNPANFGVLIATLIFPSAVDSWWIASPLILVVIFGIAIVWKMKRIDLALSFIATYFIVNYAVDMFGGELASSIYYSIINANVIYFFAMYMLIEPKTHPFGRGQRIFYGILLAAIYTLFEPSYPVTLLFLLALGNILVPFLNRMGFEFRKPQTQEPGKA